MKSIGEQSFHLVSPGQTVSYREPAALSFRALGVSYHNTSIVNHKSLIAVCFIRRHETPQTFPRCDFFFLQPSSAQGCFVGVMLSIWRLRIHLIEGQLQLSRLLCPSQNQLSAGVMQVQIVHIHTHFYHVLHCLYTARIRRRRYINCERKEKQENVK